MATVAGHVSKISNRDDYARDYGNQCADHAGCRAANKSLSVVSCRNVHNTAYLEEFLEISSVYFFFNNEYCDLILSMLSPQETKMYTPL
jgi:hypothetical protein